MTTTSFLFFQKRRVPRLPGDGVSLKYTGNTNAFVPPQSAQRVGLNYPARMFAS